MADTWTAIDFETANSDRGSVCSVGLVRVVGRVIVGRYGTLVRPPEKVRHFSFHNTAVHGITADDIDADEVPEWPEVFKLICEFADGGPLVAHNASFDMSVVRRACEHTLLGRPALDYACTLAVSRSTWPHLRDHRLPTVCAEIEHALTGHHQAEADAEAAAQIMIKAIAANGAASLAELTDNGQLSLRSLDAYTPASGAPAPATAGLRAGPVLDQFAKWQEVGRAELPEPDTSADSRGPLFGLTVCISGELDSMDKPEAWNRVAEAGGRPAKNVTKKTDVLVVADDRVRTAKHQRAEQYRAKGQRIAIVAEPDFLAMLAVAPSAK